MGQKKFAALAVLVVGAAGTLMLGTVQDVRASADSGAGDEPLAAAIAARFNLDEQDVQGVINQFHADREARRRNDMSERLQSLADNGELTSEQRALIEAELAKLDEAVNALRPENHEELSKQERQELHWQIQELHRAFWQALEDNEVDEKLVRFGHGFDRNRGGKHGGEGHM